MKGTGLERNHLDLSSYTEREEVGLGTAEAKSGAQAEMASKIITGQGTLGAPDPTRGDCTGLPLELGWESRPHTVVRASSL